MGLTGVVVAGHPALMSEEMKQQAEARLAGAFESHGLEDGRPAYRQRLRALREVNPAAFEEATRYYEEVVVPALFDGPDPLATWIDYGAWLGDRTGDGRLVSIDATGRAVTYGAPYTPGALVLRVPADASEAVLRAAVPATRSMAQQATIWLLVENRLALV